MQRSSGFTQEKPDEGDDKEGSAEVDREDGGHGHGDRNVSRQFQISGNVRMRRRFLHICPFKFDRERKKRGLVFLSGQP